MSDIFEKELDELLKEDIKSVRKRASTTFVTCEERIKANGIILFGSGLFGKRILKGLKTIGIEPLGFCDNNQNIWQTKKDGLTIYSPEEAANKFPNAVFMVTIWSDV